MGPRVISELGRKPIRTRTVLTDVQWEGNLCRAPVAAGSVVVKGTVSPGLIYRP
jgi:hypothetical protein